MASNVDRGWTRFRERLALRVLGHLPYEDMPQAATDALIAGCDSPHLGELAAMEGATWLEVRPVVEAVQRETGSDFSEAEARILAADSYLADVAAGRTDPGFIKNFWWGEFLSDLEGVYAWFGWAVYELDLLDAMEMPERLAAATLEVRRRAAWALDLTASERRSCGAPPGNDAPFPRSI